MCSLTPLAGRGSLIHGRNNFSRKAKTRPVVGRNSRGAPHQLTSCYTWVRLAYSNGIWLNRARALENSIIGSEEGRVKVAIRAAAQLLASSAVSTGTCDYPLVLCRSRQGQYCEDDGKTELLHH